MTGGGQLTRLRPRHELWLVLLLGLAGAGLVLLAMRQDWARVTAAAPKPLPAGSIEVTGQQLVPAAAALAVAAVASLAAVLATRGLLRRITGVVLVGLGAGIAVAVSTGISAADAVAAAAGSASPGTGASVGTGPGSVTSGNAPAGSGIPLAGVAGHPMLATFPWRGAALAGALLVVAAGVLVTWRAGNLPVMSSRYERQARPAGTTGSAPAEPGRGQPASGSQPSVSDAATVWESLSRGEDPTGRAGTGP